MFKVRSFSGRQATDLPLALEGDNTKQNFSE